VEHHYCAHYTPSCRFFSSVGSVRCEIYFGLCIYGLSSRSDNPVLYLKNTNIFMIRLLLINLLGRHLQ
jgi:hypothetical protein